MIKKYIGTGFVALGLLFSVGFASPAQASSLTSAQVSAIINLLQSFGADQNTINSVQVALGGSPSGSLSCSSFADLTYGNFDNNPGGRISQLQTFLFKHLWLRYLWSQNSSRVEQYVRSANDHFDTKQYCTHEYTNYPGINVKSYSNT
jgi:hypothetical protein